jgi:FdhD protein
MKTPNSQIQYYQVDLEHTHQVVAEIIVETPVSLTVNGEVWLTFMCTPVDLEAMAVGFLFNEGVIQNSEEIVQVRLCASGDNVDVWLNHDSSKPKKWRRTSGCTGGVTAIESEKITPVVGNRNGTTLTPKQICNLVADLFTAQDLYRKSGGVHTSALSDGRKIILSAEDIGRHNTLDKIAGHYLLEKIHLPRKILITTGRISSEMLQKSARLGATVVISRTSPSSLSIQMADTLGITLIGYARRDNFRVYTHPYRISGISKEMTIKIKKEENVQQESTI